MFRPSVGVSRSVDEQDRHPYACGGVLRTHRTNIKAALFRSELKGLANRAGAEEKRCAFGGDRSKIRESLCRYDRRHAFVVRGFLESHCCTEGGSDQHDWTSVNRVQDPMQVLLFEEPARACVSFRFAVCAAVIRNNVESARYESLDEADRTRSVVCDTV
jgi:hypothetical protein